MHLAGWLVGWLVVVVGSLWLDGLEGKDTNEVQDRNRISGNSAVTRRDTFRASIYQCTNIKFKIPYC